MQPFGACFLARFFEYSVQKTRYFEYAVQKSVAIFRGVGRGVEVFLLIRVSLIIGMTSYLSGTVRLECSEHWLRSFQKQFADLDSAQVLVPLVHGDLNDVIQTLSETAVHLRQFFHVEED